MRAGLVPILLQPALLKKAWHDLYFPNMLLQSNAFGTTWQVFRSAVVQSATVYAPSGSLAWKLVEDATATNTHGIQQTGIPIQEDTYTLSVWAKAGERNWFLLGLYNGTDTKTAYFNLATGATGTASSGVTSTCVASGTGYQCSLTVARTAGTGVVYMWIAEADNDFSFSGGGSAPYTEEDPGLYIADIQLYPSTILPAYAATTTLQSGSGLTDLSGNNLPMLRGSNATAADAADPAILGPGLGFTTAQYGRTADTSVNKSGAFTLILVCRPTGTTGTLVSLTDSATASTKAQRLLYSASETLKVGSVNTGAESLSGELAVENDIDQVFALYSDGTTLTAERYDTGATVSVASTNPDGNACLGLGATIGSSVANIADALKAREVVLYDRLLTAAQRRRQMGVLHDKWVSRGIPVRPFELQPLVVFDGDSWTYYGYYPAASVDGLPVDMVNHGTGGADWADVVDEGATVDALYESLAKTNIVVVLCRLNDLWTGNYTPAQIISNLETYCAARQAAGFKVVIGTMAPCTYHDTPETYPTDRATVNNSIAANWATYADGFVDYRADTRIGVDGCSDDPTYWTNGAHLNEVGYAILGGYFKPVIAGLL